MGLHFFLQRRTLAFSTCVLMLGLLMASLVGATSPSMQPAGDASSAVGEASQSLAQAEADSFSARTDPVNPKRAVRAAWEKARDAGTYAFATNLAQTTYPALTLANAGRGPEPG